MKGQRPEQMISSRTAQTLLKTYGDALERMASTFENKDFAGHVTAIINVLKENGFAGKLQKNKINELFAGPQEAAPFLNIVQQLEINEDGPITEEVKESLKTFATSFSEAINSRRMQEMQEMQEQREQEGRNVGARFIAITLGAGVLAYQASNYISFINTFATDYTKTFGAIAALGSLASGYMTCDKNMVSIGTTAIAACLSAYSMCQGKSSYVPLIASVAGLLASAYAYAYRNTPEEVVLSHGILKF